MCSSNTFWHTDLLHLLYLGQILSDITWLICMQRRKCSSIHIQNIQIWLRSWIRDHILRGVYQPCSNICVPLCFSYDVSILTSACHDGSLLRHPDHHPHPSLYAMVQKPPHHAPPTACKGDMAAMIEVKKDEADHDRDGFPYDTLHIYGYEGPESLAGSLSSLESSSTGSNLDYDFLSDWGPRFRTLAELYGVDGSDYYHQYWCRASANKHSWC